MTRTVDVRPPEERPADAVRQPASDSTRGQQPAGTEDTVVPAPRRPHCWRWLVALLVLCAGLLVWLFVEPRAVTVAEYRIASPDVPAAFDGTRIVFLSDIHHGPFLGTGRVHSLVDRVNAMKPSIVVLGGDYVHRAAKYIEPCFKELARLRATYGVYGVLGNHDHWESARRTREAMMAAGITLLDNRGVWISDDNARVRLCGVGDVWEDEQLIDPALGGADEDDFTVLVSHNPDYYAELIRLGGATRAATGGEQTAGAGGGQTASAGGLVASVEAGRTRAAEESSPPARCVDLVLAGHTHGGQVTLFGLWAWKVPSEYGQRFRSGLVDGSEGPGDTARAVSGEGGTGVPMIVSNGIGTISPPVRFCAPPQIVYVELVRER